MMPKTMPYNLSPKWYHISHIPKNPNAYINQKEHSA